MIDENTPLLDPARVRSRLSATASAAFLFAGTHKTRCCHHVLRGNPLPGRKCRQDPVESLPSERAFCVKHIDLARQEREEDIERFGLLEVETRDALFRGEIGLEVACLRLGVPSEPHTA